VPIYGFGTLHVVAEQDLGALGPTKGPVATAYCPVNDALRSGILWVVLLALLWRRPNRVRQAWAILLPLAAIYLVLGLAESRLDVPTQYYYNRHACTMICEFLRTLAVALAVLLAIADRITLRNRVLRFLLVFAILLTAGAVAILLSAPVVATAAFWTVLFAVFLLVFLIGHAILHALLRRLSGRRELAGSIVVTLALGTVPFLAFAVISRVLSGSLQLLSTRVAYREAMIRWEAITTPYFVLFWFLLLALLVPLYRQRLARCLGYDAPADNQVLGQATRAPVPQSSVRRQKGICHTLGVSHILGSDDSHENTCR
jgi:hypothetical protein